MRCGFKCREGGLSWLPSGLETKTCMCGPASFCASAFVNDFCYAKDDNEYDK